MWCGREGWLDQRVKGRLRETEGEGGRGSRVGNVGGDGEVVRERLGECW